MNHSTRVRKSRARRAIAPAAAMLSLMATAMNANAQGEPVPDAASVPAPAPRSVEPASSQSEGEARKDVRSDGSASAENRPMQDEITPELTAAVERGLAWVAKQQQPDGSFGEGRYGKNIAVTSLACIALMADGSLPGRGRYAKEVERGLEFVLQNSTETGLLASDASNGPMYGHGFAALFLGEVYGMTRGGGDTELSRRVHEALVKACDLIARSQNAEGGWRYNPVPYDADVSVTICQIMALRSARNAGLDIPKEVIDRAVEYVRQCQNPDGGFKYQLTSGFSAWPRSAAGVASLQYAGIYEDESISRGIEYLMTTALPGSGNVPAAHYYYGHYYAVQAMYLSGGNAWQRWWPAVRQELLARQQEDASWADPSVGPVYGTSMALIVLQMPKRLLPIFQK